jgi:cytochrome P450
MVEMVFDPYGFWERQRAWAKKAGLSWTSILGFYTVFVTDTDTCRMILNNNGDGQFHMAVHPNAKHILGDSNLAFMHGPVHKRLRQSFLGLFTRKALGTYVESQDQIVRRYLAEWVQYKGQREMRDLIRDMNAYTSQEVFAGPYLEDPQIRAKFSDSYRAMTEGFLAFPLCLPGTAVWKGKQGRLYIISVLEKAAERSLQLMRSGLEPKCLMDFWAVQVRLPPLLISYTINTSFSREGLFINVLVFFFFRICYCSPPPRPFSFPSHPSSLRLLNFAPIHIRPCHFTKQVLKELKESADRGEPAPAHCNVHKMADVVMDFLFASQDASTASLTWILALMADHPDVFEKVRDGSSLYLIPVISYVESTTPLRSPDLPRADHTLSFLSPPPSLPTYTYIT